MDGMRRAKILFLNLLAFSVAGASGNKLGVAHFVPGKYTLVEGESKYCGEGDFYLTKDRKRIWLGPYYSFTTAPSLVSDKGGLPMDKGCIYRTKTDVHVVKNETVFTAVDTLQCGSVTRHVVTNKVTINERKVTLDQTQEVNPKYYYNSGGVPHSCLWKPEKSNFGNRERF